MVFGNRSSRSQASCSSSSSLNITTPNNSKRQAKGNHIKPLEILTNAIVSVSNTAPMSGSIPFPFDQEPYTPPSKRSIKSSSMLDLNDPQTYRPKPNGFHVDLILQQATCAGWITKHRAPTFSFIKTTKRRYVVLVDRMLYAFKSEKPDTYREFLELTKDTHAFATDQFSGELYCIEIKKRGYGYEDAASWFLQADNAESMKLWLDRIKRTIAWLRTGEASGTITKGTLTKIITEDDEYSLVANNTKQQTIYSSPTSSQSNLSLSDSNSWPYSLSSSFVVASPIQATHNPNTSNIENESILSFSSSEYSYVERNNSLGGSRKSSLRVARPSVSSSANYKLVPAVLPPQLPPPKSQLPPIPSYAYL